VKTINEMEKKRCNRKKTSGGPMGNKSGQRCKKKTWGMRGTFRASWFLSHIIALKEQDRQRKGIQGRGGFREVDTTVMSKGGTLYKGGTRSKP